MSFGCCRAVPDRQGKIKTGGFEIRSGWPPSAQSQSQRELLHRIACRATAVLISLLSQELDISACVRCIMEELDRRKNEALVAVTLCTGTLIACFGIVLAML